MKAIEISEYLHQAGIDTITQETGKPGFWNSCRIRKIGNYDLECLFTDKDFQIRLVSQTGRHDALISLAPWITDDLNEVGIFAVTNLSKDQRFLNFYFSQNNWFESFTQFTKILNRYLLFSA